MFWDKFDLLGIKGLNKLDSSNSPRYFPLWIQTRMNTYLPVLQFKKKIFFIQIIVFQFLWYWKSIIEQCLYINLLQIQRFWSLCGAPMRGVLIAPSLPSPAPPHWGRSSPRQRINRHQGGPGQGRSSRSRKSQNNIWNIKKYTKNFQNDARGKTKEWKIFFCYIQGPNKSKFVCRQSYLLKINWSLTSLRWFWNFLTERDTADGTTDW